MTEKGGHKLALHCASCGRAGNSGKTIAYLGIEWCSSCARVGTTNTGSVFVSQPSPGRMVRAKVDVPLEAWIDCYEMKPKKRILVKEAKSEVQRAWRLWNGGKTGNIAMLEFFGWLQRHRPLFLTFRCKGDPWQTVHSWLIQYEDGTKLKC